MTHIHPIQTSSLGQCWLEVSQKILAEGHPARYDGAPIKEIANLTTVVEAPDPEDSLSHQHGDPSWLAWMHDNFFVQKEVAELGHADSYAIRLFNYARQGHDQI